MYSVIDNVNFSQKNFYELLDNYFESPTLEKVQNTKNTSVYMCKIHTLLASPEQRYLVAITEQDKNPLGKKLPLENINWKSFQTRTFGNVEKQIISHKYSPKNLPQYTLNVSVKNRYEDHTEYNLDKYNVVVTLIHKNKNLYEYPPSGNLASCLETYKTVITFHNFDNNNKALH
jgi:hypothetical protein